MTCKIVGHMPNTAAQAKVVMEKYAYTTKKRNKVLKAMPKEKGKTNVGNPNEKGKSGVKTGAFDPKSKSHLKAMRKVARKSKV